MISTNKADLIARVEAALDDLRPHLRTDGGDIELIDISDDYVVTIQWLGNCNNCNMSEFTLKAGLEQSLKSKVPEILAINALHSTN